ncbi:MAG: hypothetical protein K9J79_05545, partial [Desulfobacteraceae bacterium]|nr:hypothetical protein [Desulfobacteraceae bacterium]
IREEQARERASYIQDELRMAKERLNKKEAQMRDYKLKHYNEMPQQRSANMSRLNALQEQYSSLQTNIYNLEQTRMLVAEQLEVRRKQQEAAADGEEGGSATRTGQSSRAQKLAAARSRLQDLMSRYTPQHPEVKRLERRIEQLKSGQNSGQEQSGQEPAENNGKMSALIGQDKRIGELAAQLKEIDVNLKTLRREAENIREQMKKYQRWIDAAPEREAEWASLTRDYEELKQYHDELLSRSLAAEAAESLEVRQKGSQFKVIDSAYLPRTPIKGTFLKILMLSLFAGAAAGGGLVVTLDFLDTSFKESQEVESTLQLPVTCALPLIVTEAEKKRERIKSIIWSLFFSAWAMALAATVVYFWQQGDILI